MFHHNNHLSLANKLKKKNLNYFIFSFLFLIIIGISSSASANENYIDEEDLTGDIETVVSATRLNQKITETPVSVTIIDKEMIQASGAIDIYELFRLVPGYFSYAANGANHHAVASHFKPTNIPSRLEVQVNGRSIYQPLYDTVDWSSLGIDVLDIDHIEVVRGSSASTYGSNAFLGAINIVTVGNNLQKHESTIRAVVGSQDRKKLTINHSTNISELEYFVSLTAEENTGFKPLDLTSSQRVKNIDDKESINLNVEGSYTPNFNNRFKIDMGIGSSDIHLPTRNDPRGYSIRKHVSNHQRLRWENGDPRNGQSISFYHNYLQLEDDLTPGELSTLLGITPAQVPFIFPGQSDLTLYIDQGKAVSERFEIETEKKIQSTNYQAVVGAAIKKDTVKSKFLIGSATKHQRSYKLFGNIDYRFNKKLNANLGFLTEKFESLGTYSSPRLAFNYQIDDNRTIRTSFTKGKHAPSIVINDAYSSFTFPDGSLIDLVAFSPNDIKPESLKAHELAYLHRWPENNSQIELRLFNEEIRDIINYREQPYFDIDQKVRVLGNIQRLTNKGLELEFKYKPTFFSNVDLRLAYAYIDSDFKSIGEPIRTADGAEIPKHSGTLLVNKKLKRGLNFSTVVQYQSDVKNEGLGIKRVDLRLSKEFKKSNNNSSKVDLIIQNAFNHYNDFNSRQDVGTRAFLRLQTSF